MGLDQAIHVVTQKRTDMEISPIVIARIFKHFVNLHKFDIILMGKLVSFILNKGKRLLMIVVNKQRRFYQECLMRPLLQTRTKYNLKKMGLLRFLRMWMKELSK